MMKSDLEGMFVSSTEISNKIALIRDLNQGNSGIMIKKQ